MAKLIVTALKDSYMDGYKPDTNYGANGTIALGIFLAGGAKDQLMHAIGNFDVSALPAGTTVIAAKMLRTLTLADPSPHSCRIVRCKRTTEWTENGVTWNKYDGINNWTVGGAWPDDTDEVTPPYVSYNEAVVAGDYEVTGLAGFVRDALDNRAGIISILMRPEEYSPPVSQRSIWLAKTFWKLIIDYDPVGAVGGLSAEAFIGARPGRAARPHHPAATRAPIPPHRTAHHKGGTP